MTKNIELLHWELRSAAVRWKKSYGAELNWRISRQVEPQDFWCGGCWEKQRKHRKEETKVDGDESSDRIEGPKIEHAQVYKDIGREDLYEL